MLSLSPIRAQLAQADASPVLGIVYHLTPCDSPKVRPRRAQAHEHNLACEFSRLLEVVQGERASE